MKNNITTILAENPEIILESHLLPVISAGLFQCFPNAIFQLGINYHRLDDDIDTQLRKVIEDMHIDQRGDIEKQLDVLSEEVLKQWKQILNI